MAAPDPPHLDGRAPSNPYVISPLPPDLRGALIGIFICALLSVLATSGLIIFLTYRFIRWRRYYSKYPGYNQCILLIFNLLIADFQQSMGLAITPYWLQTNQLSAYSPVCFVQGWLVNIGDISSGLFVLAIAVHTFTVVIKRKTIPWGAFVACIIGLWIFCVVITLVAPAKFGRHVYVPSGSWCWVDKKYELERLYVHYLWIFIAEFGIVIIYTSLLLVLRHRLKASKRLGISHDATTQKFKKVIRYMFIYPLAYIFLSLPIAAGRMSLMNGNDPGTTYFYGAGAIIMSSGWVDAILYFITRRRLVEADIDSTGGTNSNRGYANMSSSWAGATSSSKGEAPKHSSDTRLGAHASATRSTDHIVESFGMADFGRVHQTTVIEVSSEPAGRSSPPDLLPTGATAAGSNISLPPQFIGSLPEPTPKSQEILGTRCFLHRGRDDGDEEEDIEFLRVGALQIASRVVKELGCINHERVTLEFLASGGYNHVWLVTYIPETATVDRAIEPKKLVLRIPKVTATSLQPYQLRHEVACLKFLAEKLPDIPAPRVLLWDDTGRAFMAQEFIEGQRLSVAWPQLTEDEKANICWSIANVVATLGETRFDFIGGFALDASAGPTIEAAKIFNGRAKFHSPECYNIGPYSNTEEYVHACYDREIYYYTHADKGDIIMDAFENTSVAQFIDDLKLARENLESQQFQAVDAEPRVLVHEDFHSGNMIVHNGRLVGIVDWEFSGVYPLSEMLGAIPLIQVSSGERNDPMTADDELEWDQRYNRDLETVVRQRGWSEANIHTLLRSNWPDFQKARMIMFPESEDGDGDQIEEEGAGKVSSREQHIQGEIHKN